MTRCKDRSTIIFCSVSEVQSRNFKVLCCVSKWSVRKCVWRDGFGACELQGLAAKNLVSPEVQVKGEKISVMSIIDKAITGMKVICRNRCSSLAQSRRWVTRNEKLKALHEEWGWLCFGCIRHPVQMALTACAHATDQVHPTLTSQSPQRRTCRPAALPTLACFLV